MDAVMELEGPWEEIAARTAELEGTYVHLTVLSPERKASPYARKMGAILDELEANHADMPMTSGETTQRLLREARDGGMYGHDAGS